MAAAGTAGAAALPRLPGEPTPPEVLSALALAYGTDGVGETGYDIAAARCCSDAEKAEARRTGSSLLYGELLPDGVSKALSSNELGQALDVAVGGSRVLELGMGSGKVAMQVFLQRPDVQQVVGVEIVQSRYVIGEAALRRLVGQRPEAYRGVSNNPTSASIEDTGGRRLEFHCADFFSLGLELCSSSDVIFFAVHIPCKLFPQLCQRFSTAKEGCRLFTYHALDTIWWTDEPCPFRQIEENKQETDTFSTSWSPQGYKFYVYVCDRSHKVPEIQAGLRNETFSEWQVMWDEAAQGSYFHNQETEASQWEVPSQAGCWHAVWSAEWSAYFFWHEPTGHSQWEVPRCLADLGWTSSV